MKIVVPANSMCLQLKMISKMCQKLVSLDLRTALKHKTSNSKYTLEKKKISGAALAQLSFTLHYGRRIFYYQHYIHI